MKSSPAFLAGVVGLGAILIGSSRPTIAAFVDVGVATGSIVSGSIDILLSDQDEGFKNNLLTHTWVLTDALPGAAPVCESVQFTNAGVRAAANTSVALVNSGSGGSPMAEEIVFTLLTLGATNLLPQVNPTLDGHPGVSARDLELQGGISGLPGLFANQSNSRSLGACLELHGDAPNSLQGKTWLGTFTITISQ